MAKATITGSPTVGQTIDDKRFYVKGVVVEIPCSKCNKITRVDLGHHYLGYPQVGVPETLSACCDHCDEEVETEIILDLNVRLA